MISHCVRSSSAGRSVAGMMMFCALIGLSGQQAMAQDSAQSSAASGQSQAWRKLCPQDNKAPCFIEQQVAAGGRVVMVGSFGYKSDSEPVAVVTVPLNTLLKPGIAFKVDDNEQIVAQFDICGRRGCRAEVPLTVDMIAELKAGRFLGIGWRMPDGKNQSLRFSLEGFKANWDSIASK